tara:strand:+ start:607 stop:1194 length:588 start_codon:yes stop_codon:yes gene_type:complete
MRDMSIDCLTGTLVFESSKHYQIVANSGSGKTSLLRSLYGINEEYSGNIFIDDENIKSYNTKAWSEIRRNKFSFAFQNHFLLEDFSLMENILIKSQISPFYSINDIHDLLNEFGLYSKKNVKLRILSSGERQRTSILRALCCQFEWLILDEPFNNLDDKNILVVRDAIMQRTDQTNAGVIVADVTEYEHYNNIIN